MTTDLTRLPDQVRERLAARDIEPGVAIRAGRRAEAVPFVAELRSDPRGTPVLEGYATVYGYTYDVLGGPESAVGWAETITRGAFDKSVAERDDVRLLVNHDGLALARTRSGTLELGSDSTGVHIRAALDPRSPTVASLVSALERGDADEMSMQMKVLEQRWDDNYTERQIDTGKLYDVSVVTFPASGAAVARLAPDQIAPRSAQPAEGMSLATARALADASRSRSA